MRGSFVFSRATAIIAGATSIPVTCASGHRSATSIAPAPVPVPTSSTRCGGGGQEVERGGQRLQPLGSLA